jgi:hypothetical protein
MTQNKTVSMTEDTLRMLESIREAFGIKVSDSAIIRKAIEQFYYDVCQTPHNRVNCPKQGSST